MKKESLLRLDNYKKQVMAAVCAISVVMLMANTSQAAAAATTVHIAVDGQANMPIVIATKHHQAKVARSQLQSYGKLEITQVPAGTVTRDAANTLAQYLGKMVGSSFSVTEGDGSTGIAVGVASDFPKLDLAGKFSEPGRFTSEQYLIHTHAGGVYLIGATEQAVEHAVWDFLYRLGYRQFFPGKTWEIIPHTPSLSAAIDAFESPDYHSRLIWYGGGYLDHNEQLYRQWAARNRATAGFVLNTSHEYNNIRKRHEQAFAEHPQYFAMIDGQHKATPHAKFNVASPGLQQLVIDDAITWFEQHPNEVSKSMDPSDFGGWSEDGPSSKLGSPTDQALTLANVVADAVQSQFPEQRFVGMYAYYDHQRPPTNVTVHPNVIISFATRFLKPGLTIEQLMEGWRAKGLKQLGIREYYGVGMWDWSVPAMSYQGGSIDYLAHTIPAFHRLGARMLTSESSDAWGSIGLGHYLASRMLWDVDEADRVDALVDDFLDKSFGPARQPMAAFYQLINGDDRPLLYDDSVNRMYSLLAQASELAAGHADVQQRIDELILYTRYLELFQAYKASSTEARQKAFEAVIRYGYRIRETSMAHTAVLYKRHYFDRQEKHATIPAEAAWSVPEDQNPWKSSELFSRAELDGFAAAGAQRYREHQANRRAFKLVHADNAGGSAWSPSLRDGAIYLVHTAAGDEVTLTVSCRPMGFSVGPAYQVVSPAQRTVASGRVHVGNDQQIRFRASESGVYVLAFDGTANAMRVTSEHPLAIFARDVWGVDGRVHVTRPSGTLYFQLPAGVKNAQVTVFGQGKGEKVQAWLIDPAGNAVDHKDGITGEQPHEFTIQRDDANELQVWGVTLRKPSEGYFEDVYIHLSSEIPPVLWTDPSEMFIAK